MNGENPARQQGDYQQFRRLPEPKPVNPFDGVGIAQQSFAWADLMGRDRWETTWTPAATSWTFVGTPTWSGRHKFVGRQCHFQAKVVPATSLATTSGVSYINLPIAAAGFGAAIVMHDITAFTSATLCSLDVVNSRVYVLTTIGANGGTWIIAGNFEV